MEFQEIAAKLGVHRGTLFHWMSGNRSPSKMSMLKIQEELGWPVADQMAAYNEVEVDEEGHPTGVDGYGKALRAYLERNHGAPEAEPGRVGPRS